jgi:NitT/TauT family transport system permease protein
MGSALGAPLRQNVMNRAAEATAGAAEKAAATILAGGAAGKAADAIILVASVLLLWQALHAAVGTTALPAPLPTFSYLAKLVASPRFLENASVTLRSFAAALAIAYVLGLAVGIWMGLRRLAGEVGEPILIALYSMPKITLYPVVLLIFGLGMSGKIAFGVMHGVLPVAILTMNAIRKVRPVFVKAAKTMHISPRQTIFSVILPASLPEVVSGLRMGFTLTLLGVLLGEMFAAKHGLGSMLMNAVTLAQSEEMLAIALLVFAFAAIANGLLLRIERRLHRGS